MKLLFYVSKLYSLPVIEPLAKEALGRNIDYAIFASSKVERNLPTSLSNATVFRDLHDAIEFSADYVLCPGNFVDFRLPGIKVELFHGIGIEKPSHYKIRHFFDIYLTSGPVVTQRFLKIQKKHEYFSVIETGWPKMDHILSYDTSDLRAHYEIPDGKKVILYAPTHSSRMESANSITSIIDSIMKEDEVWFCKPHEFIGKNVLDQLRKNNLVIVDSYDITPYLHLADVLVSDTSSVLYEFMALNKPVITMNTLSREDKGININSTEQLRSALDRSLEYPLEFAEERERHLKEVNPRLDCSISSTVLSLLENMAGKLPAGRRRKPMNLFRKMQVLYHSRFRKGYLR